MSDSGNRDSHVKGRRNERGHSAKDGRYVAAADWFAGRYSNLAASTPAPRDQVVLRAQRSGLVPACRRVAYADTDEELRAALDDLHKRFGGGWTP